MPHTRMRRVGPRQRQLPYAPQVSGVVWAPPPPGRTARTLVTLAQASSTLVKSRKPGCQMVLGSLTVGGGVPVWACCSGSGSHRVLWGPGWGT